MKAVAIDLDGALGDTRPLFEAWLEDASRKLRADLGGGAEAVLDERLGNWRPLLERFAEEHAAVYLRPRGQANAVLRKLQAAGVRLGAFTGTPEPLARVALAQLGAARHVDVLECGDGALDRLLATLGEETVVVRSLPDLTAA